MKSSSKLSPEDSLFLIKSILSSNEPNEKLKALFSKDNNEILKELLKKKKVNSSSVVNYHSREII